MLSTLESGLVYMRPTLLLLLLLLLLLPPKRKSR